MVTPLPAEEGRAVRRIYLHAAATLALPVAILALIPSLAAIYVVDHEAAQRRADMTATAVKLCAVASEDRAVMRAVLGYAKATALRNAGGDEARRAAVEAFYDNALELAPEVTCNKDGDPSTGKTTGKGG